MNLPSTRNAIGSASVARNVFLQKAALRLAGLLPRTLEGWVVATARICSRYRAMYGRWPNLLHPKTFSEKMQWRKLFESEPLFGVFCDKLAVRDYVADRVGPDRLIPLLWSGDDPERIPFETLTAPYVIKSTHACGHVVMVSDAASIDRDAVREKASGWLRQHYASIAVEPAYRNARPRIAVERMVVTPEGGRPVERRLFVFDGTVQMIQTTSVWADGIPRHTAFHTRLWERLPWLLLSPKFDGETPRPECLDEMIRLAEALGAGLSHLRVDFYDVGDRIWIGELTVYSWSGFVPFNPVEADALLGRFWVVPTPMRRALRVLARTRHDTLCLPDDRSRAGARSKASGNLPGKPSPAGDFGIRPNVV